MDGKVKEVEPNFSASSIRAVLKYLKDYKESLFVIQITDAILQTPAFYSLIQDIALLHSLGIKIIIVPSCASYISEKLRKSNIEFSFNNGVRLVGKEAIEVIKEASNKAVFRIIDALYSYKIVGITGDFIRSRSLGVVNGVDYKRAGVVDKVNSKAIMKVCEAGFIIVLPCYAQNEAGVFYNLSTMFLAYKLATVLKAKKLFYTVWEAVIGKRKFNIPKNIALNPSGEATSLNLKEVEEFLNANKDKRGEEEGRLNRVLEAVRLAGEAVKEKVDRVHILDARREGALLNEVFLPLGSSLMVYQDKYLYIKKLTVKKINAVLLLMTPFIKSGRLLERSYKDIKENIDDYVVFSLDKEVKGVAALHIYPDGQAEISAVAVDSEAVNLGYGEVLVSYLIKKAKEAGANSIFLLTTQAKDWFMKFGFREDANIESLPKERLKTYSYKRHSILLRLEGDKKE